ncbi:MAG TPA: hypothetical protein VK752_20675 [Bryobacteraceae bacterium]|nr:hypothetical protein [Bryobacteraceae bacterium]
MKSITRMSLASLMRGVLFLAVLWSIAPVNAAPGWNEATAMPVDTINCITQQAETLSLSSVAWFGDPNSPPQVNTVYYARVSWGVTGKPCAGGAQVAPELFLPDGTSLAISAAFPVKCLAVNLSTFATSPETAQCPQAPSTGLLGGLGFYPTGGTNAAWPTAQGFGWQIQVPLISTVPLSGTVTSSDPTVACFSCLTAAVWSIDGVESPWAYPRVGVRISGSSGMPTITYPSPSTTNVTSTTATGTATLDRQNTTGTVFAQHSATPPSASTCQSNTNNVSVIQSSPTVSPVTITFSNLPSGAYRYWRMCYSTGSTTYIGATQSFRTPGSPPQITSISPAMALPGDSVTIIGNNLAGATSVSIQGSQGPVSAGITSKTASAVTFAVPNIAFQTGTVSVTTPDGTATSTSTFTVGIDTLLDSYQVSTVNGATNLTIHFHSTEPAPSAQFDCHLSTSAYASTCDGGVVTYTALSTGIYSVDITAHYSGFRDPTPLALHFDFLPHYGPLQPKSLLHTGSTSVLTDEDSTLECTRNATAGWTACASADSSTALPAAMKRLVVAARDLDGNGNPGPARRGVSVDPLPFETVLLTGFPEADVKTTTGRTASFSFQSKHGADFQCSLDYAAWASCSGQVFLDDLAVGPHTFLVRAVDSAGNVDLSPATKSWTIE